MLKQKKRRSRKFKDTSRIIDMEQARRERRNKRAAAAEKPKNRRTNTNTARSEARAAKKVKRRLFYTAIFLVMIAVIGVAAYNIISLRIQEKDLKAEYKALEKQKSKLEYELSQIDTPEYVEQQARQMLRMIKPGEILYVFPEEEEKTTNSGIIPEEKKK